MININTITERWTDPARRPLFKGQLIDTDGCCCAQGDILRHECRLTDTQLRQMPQSDADRQVASTLGISRFHAVLLRIVNDSQQGCPQDVLTNPAKVLGDQWEALLSFGWHLDRMTAKQWAAARDAAWDAAWAAAWAAAGAAARDAAWAAARDAARAAAWDAAWAAARDAAWAAAWAAAWDAAWDAAGAAAGAAAWDAAGDAAGAAARDAAGDAAGEIQGHKLMAERGQALYFLPLFGFTSVEEIPIVPVFQHKADTHAKAL